MGSDDRLLIAHDNTDPYLDRITARFPDLPLHVYDGGELLADMLERIAPTIVFACKCDGVPGSMHNPMLKHSSVKWFHNAGVGMDHLAEWDGDRVAVTNSAGVLSPFLAQTTMGMILALNLGLPGYLRQQSRCEWQENPWTGLQGKTLLVIGLGAIGSRVAAHAKAFGMHVIGIRNSPSPSESVDEQVPRAQLIEVLPRADFVCLHVPNTSDTHHLIDAATLKAMKPTAYLLNLARGPVVNEAALIEALESGVIAGAYLDVFDTEPLPPDSRLWGLENVIITPHVSDSVDDWPSHMAEFFCDNLDRWLKGEPLVNQLDPRRGY
jgi:phosphoglycerate dehydrogenase-like enzyme